MLGAQHVRITDAARVTDALVEEAGANRAAVTVTFVEVSKEDYASGGILLADKQ